MEFAVLQPNIDPYTDKFGGMTQMQQTDVLLGLASEASKNAKEQILVAPETFIFTESWSRRLQEEAPGNNRAYAAIENWVVGEEARGNEKSFIVNIVVAVLLWCRQLSGCVRKEELIGQLVYWSSRWYPFFYFGLFTH